VIPVNDAITAAVVSMALVCAITGWALWGYWRARVEDAYQDGHAAGIATQIGRQQRAAGRRPGPPATVTPGPLARRAAAEYAARRGWSWPLPGPAADGRAAADAEALTEVIVADVTTAGPRHAAGRPLPGGGWTVTAARAGRLDPGRPVAPVIPFPEGLPPGLREHAAQVLDAARALPPATGGPVPAG
jgi:hypothetical protein